MPIELLSATSLNLDRGPEPGQHLWVVSELLNFEGGYERSPQWEVVSTNTVTSGYDPYGIFSWKGDPLPRIYYADNDNIYEVSGAGAFTNVTGTTLTNDTNGVSFAAFGPYALASNGVDKIQIIKVPATTGTSENFADMEYTTTGAVIAPKYICSHKNHIVAANIKFLQSYGTISTITTPVGGGYTNQPTGGSIQILSSDAADTSKTVTIYGTTQGSDTLVAEVMSTNAANGTTAVTSTKTDWGKILGVKKAVTAGTITVRKTSGAATITTLAPADTKNSVTSVGVNSRAAGGQLIDIVASAATTKQVGYVGTNYNSNLAYDSQALTGTTTVQSNKVYDTVVEVYTGDVENTITVTITTHLYAAGYEDPYLVWVSGTDNQNGWGDPTYAPTIPGSDRFPLLDGTGKITGVADGGDAFFVFKEGSVHRFDGPPFHSAIVNEQVGQAPLNTPYRQGDRVYFYSHAGLRYIDIISNQVSNPFVGKVARSTIDFTNPVTGFLIGAFPNSRTSVIEAGNAANIDSYASIFGDYKYDLVWTAYRSAVVGAKGVILNEARDECYLTKMLPENVAPFYGVAFTNNSDNFPGEGVRGIVRTSATVHSFYKLTPTGLNDNGADSYMRWPFISFNPNGQGRISRVKPIFSTANIASGAETPSVKVEIISLTGTGKSWKVDGVFKTGLNTTSGSKDGWIDVTGVPYADRHSVGVSFIETTSGNPITVANFTGVLVEWEQAPAHAM